jgi:hypothetical protein
MYPNVRDDFDADFYVQQIRRLSTNWTFHIGPEDSAALKNIFEKQIKTPDEYCAINEKYNEKHKRNISFDVNYAFYKDNAWKESFFNPIETLFKKGSEQPKGVEAANVAKPKETQGLTVQSLMKQAKDKTLAGKSTQDTSSSAGGGITNKAVQGIGTATRSVSSQIPTLLQQAGVEGTSLNQDTINKLYDKLSKKA